MGEVWMIKLKNAESYGWSF